MNMNHIPTTYEKKLSETNQFERKIIILWSSTVSKEYQIIIFIVYKVVVLELERFFLLLLCGLKKRFSKRIVRFFHFLLVKSDFCQFFWQDIYFYFEGNVFPLDLWAKMIIIYALNQALRY
jgi:hypothetical protein